MIEILFLKYITFDNSQNVYWILVYIFLVHFSKVTLPSIQIESNIYANPLNGS